MLPAPGRGRKRNLELGRGAKPGCPSEKVWLPGGSEAGCPSEKVWLPGRSEAGVSLRKGLAAGWKRSRGVPKVWLPGGPERYPQKPGPEDL